MSMTLAEVAKRLKALKARCERLIVSSDRGPEEWRKDAEALDLALSALRPVSREQVILCKDCRYWQGNNGGYPHPECRWGNDETPDEDDYCSFAERLEVSKNG